MSLKQSLYPICLQEIDSKNWSLEKSFQNCSSFLGVRTFVTLGDHFSFSGPFLVLKWTGDGDCTPYWHLVAGRGEHGVKWGDTLLVSTLYYRSDSGPEDKRSCHGRNWSSYFYLSTRWMYVSSLSSLTLVLLSFLTLWLDPPLRPLFHDYFLSLKLPLSQAPTSYL